MTKAGNARGAKDCVDMLAAVQFYIGNAALREAEIVLVGPVLWDIPPGADVRVWYFLTAGGRAEGAEFHLAQMKCTTKQEAEQARQTLVLALALGTPRTIHDFGAELEFCQFAAHYWPCERSGKLLARVESAA